MKTLPILSLAFALLLGVTSTRAENRTWTSITGTKVEAELITQNSTHVDLKLKDGRIIHLGKDQLVTEDNAFLVAKKRPVESPTPAPKPVKKIMPTLDFGENRIWTVFYAPKKPTTFKAKFIAQTKTEAIIRFPASSRIIQKEKLSEEDQKHLETLPLDEKKFERYAHFYSWKQKELPPFDGYYNSETENDLIFRLFSDDSIITVPRDKFEGWKTAGSTKKGEVFGYGKQIAWTVSTFPEDPNFKLEDNFLVLSSHDKPLELTAEKTIKINASKHKRFFIQVVNPEMEPGYYRIEIEHSGNVKAFISLRHGENKVQLMRAPREKNENPASYIKIEKKIKKCYLVLEVEGTSAEIKQIKLFKIAAPKKT